MLLLEVTYRDHRVLSASGLTESYSTPPKALSICLLNTDRHGHWHLTRKPTPVPDHPYSTETFQCPVGAALCHLHILPVLPGTEPKAAHSTPGVAAPAPNPAGQPPLVTEGWLSSMQPKMQLALLEARARCWPAVRLTAAQPSERCLLLPAQDMHRYKYQAVVRVHLLFHWPEVTWLSYTHIS